jgi:hypothetical protein
VAFLNDLADSTRSSPRLSTRFWHAVERVHALLLDNRGVAVLLAVVFFACAAWCGLSRRYLQDEGLVTHATASALRCGLVGGFFALKAKPPLIFLYAPFSAIGFDAFLVVHAALAAFTVWIAAETARKLGVIHPNAAGWVLASSFGYMVGASNGFPNVDGAFFNALFLYSYFTSHYTWAGIILGVLPFVRHELGAISLIFLAWDLWHRRRPLIILAAAAFPLVYVGAGAIYHGDLLWLAHHFPDFTEKPAAIRGFDLPSLPFLGRYMLTSVAVNLGVLGLLSPFGWDKTDRRSLLVWGAGWGTLAIMAMLQETGRFGFDTSLRQHLALIPLLAVAVAYAWSASRLSPWLGGAAFAGGLILFPATRSPFLLVPMAGMLLRARMRAAHHAKGMELIILGGALLCLMHNIAVSEYAREQSRLSRSLFHSLVESGIYHGQTVYTDLHVARYDRWPGVPRVLYLANESVRWEAERLVTPGSPQHRAMVRALHCAGFLLAPEAHRVQTDAVYVLREGERMRKWQEHIEQLHPQRVPLVQGFVALYWDPKGDRVLTHTGGQ